MPKQQKQHSPELIGPVSPIELDAGNFHSAFQLQGVHGACNASLGLPKVQKYEARVFR